jgi:hypothetical protein
MSQNFLRRGIPLVAALALAAGVAAADAKTPLGKWMQPNMTVPRMGEDYPSLQKAFDFVAGRPPSGDYPQWSKISKAGSAAAAKQNLKAVRAACDQCHDAYKKKYIKEHAATPFP